MSEALTAFLSTPNCWASGRAGLVGAVRAASVCTRTVSWPTIVEMTLPGMPAVEIADCAFSS